MEEEENEELVLTTNPVSRCGRKRRFDQYMTAIPGSGNSKCKFCKEIVSENTEIRHHIQRQCLRAPAHLTVKASLADLEVLSGDNIIPRRLRNATKKSTSEIQEQDEPEDQPLKTQKSSHRQRKKVVNTQHLEAVALAETNVEDPRLLASGEIQADMLKPRVEKAKLPPDDDEVGAESGPDIDHEQIAGGRMPQPAPAHELPPVQMLMTQLLVAQLATAAQMLQNLQPAACQCAQVRCNTMVHAGVQEPTSKGPSNACVHSTLKVKIFITKPISLEEECDLTFKILQLAKKDGKAQDPVTVESRVENGFCVLLCHCNNHMIADSIFNTFKNYNYNGIETNASYI